jgi:hypothetical protein
VTDRTAILLNRLLGVVPKANLVSVDQYRATMADAGFEEVEVEDVTDDVFPGFVGFLEKRGIGWAIFSSVLKMWVGAGARFVIVTGTANGSVSQ